ncbi:MAG: hemoblobin-interacting domain-containing protein, partial [Bacteroidota bacterium]
MKEKLFKHLIFIAFMIGIFFSESANSQTAGTLTFVVNPVSHSGSYTLRHFVAAWIENTSPAFIKTRNRYGSAGNCSSHLTVWKASSPTQSVIDATTAATLAAYAPLTFTWTANDITGTTPYNLLPDGDYKIWVEYAWDDTPSNQNDSVSVQFTKGPTGVSLSPADRTNFTGMSLTWTPAAQITVTTSAIASSTCYIGAPLNVPFTLGTGTFYNNNTWTAQLSDATGSFASPITIGTLTGTTAGTISAVIPAGTAPGTGYRVRVIGSQPASVGTDNGTNLTLVVASTPPTLNASVGATVDNPVNITFADDAAWRATVTAVKIGTTTLTSPTDYVLSAGNLQLKPAGLNTLLTTSGSKSISIVATGYDNATLTQIIAAGVPTKLGMKTQPAAPLTNGAVLGTQPEVYIQDQYGNTTTSTAVVNVAIGSGVWTLGGITADTAIAGTASFAGLTATSTANIMVTLTFTSTGLTSVTSNPFNIPFSGQSWGQTAGTLTLTINPVSHNGSYGLRHVVAAWIESATGTFIKTRDRLTASQSSHLLIWRAATPALSVVDATAGATLASYDPVTITPWIGNDITGSAPYNLVPDGNYKVWFEYAWDDPAGPTTEDYVSLQFTKGPTPVTLTPANLTNFTGITLKWLPAAQNSITTLALSGNTYAAGAAASVPFTIGTGTFFNNNVWTAQLSDANGSFANPINIGTLTGTTAGTISATIPAGAPAGTGYRVRVVGSQPQTPGTDNGSNITITNGISPTLVAAIGATVDSSFNITFTDDAVWRAAVTGVKIGGTALTLNTDYVLTAGNLQLKPGGLNALLTSSGTKLVSISSTGYGDASVNQDLGAGVATKLGIKTQPAPPATNGSVLATQPEVYIQDQYGNKTTSTATVNAAVGIGSWTLGGTTSAAGISGVASFTDLTASSASFVGATIVFTSPGLTSVTSNTFYVPFPLSGNVTVGTGGDFTSFTKSDGLFSVINASGLSGNLNVSVISDITIEDGATALNQWIEYGGSGYTLTIQPSGGVSRTVSGTVAAPLFNFNGADRVTINGLNTGGNALTISNLSTAATAGTSTIQFIADATNNTITNCTILGSSTAPLATNGGNIFFSTGTTTGNDSITVSNCKIGPAGTNLPSKGIFANGSTASAAIANSNILINNCELYDFFLTGGCAGIYALTGNTDWSIINNKVYQTATRTFTAAGTMNGIYFANSTYGNNIQITGNTVGYNSNAGTGTFTLAGTVAGAFQGIYMQAMSTASATCNLNANILTNISMTSSSGTFNGIYNASSASSNTINVNNNQIKNINLITTTGTATVMYAGSATTLNCNLNTLDGISRNGAGTFYAIRYNQPTSVTFNGDTIRNLSSTSTSSTSAIYGFYSSSSVSTENLIGNCVYNISSSSTGAQTIYGWYNNTGSGTKTVQNNKIYSISTAAGSGVIYGIRFANGSTSEISGNQIYSLSGGLTIYGLNIGGGTTNNVFKNKIYDLSTTNAAPTVYGLYISAGTANNIYNNLVGDLRTTAANAANPLVGIYISGGTTDNIYYNTVNLNATSSGAAFGSSAIYASTTPTVNLRNNIFVNTSTPNGTTSYTCAYRRSAGAAGNLSTYASTSNNNLYYAGTPGANKLIYYDGTSSAQTLAAYKAGVFTAGTIAPRDANSISENPVWVSTLGSAATFLHINTTTPTQIEGGASTIATITDDYDGNLRDVNTPDIGADEFAGTPLDLSAPVISYTPLGNQLVSASVVLTATITDASNVPKSGTGLPVLYYKINSGTYSPITGVSIGSNQFAFSFSPTTVIGDVVSYYVVAQDSSSAKNTIANPAIGASGYTTNPPACSTPPTTPYTYLTTAAYSGTYNVGTAETYTSLTRTGGFFAAINAGVVTGNIIINVTSDLTEDGTNALNQWAEANGSGYTLTILPSGGAARTISGTADGIPMINFNGADRVTIDGLNTGGNSFVISNLSVAATAGTSTIQFIADATNNMITNCSILGSSTVPLATNGGNICINTGTVTGNDNITISNCKIGPAGTNLPSKGICGMGSTSSSAIANSNITINNCEIYDFFLTAGCAAIYATTGNTDWNITNNDIYQTATRTFTATGTMTGIYFVNATYGDDVQITGNTIGFASNAGTGSLTLTGTVAGAFQGIYMQTMPTATLACNINSNVVSNISLTSSTGAFTAIYNNSSASSNTININNNKVRNIDLITTTGTAQGIYAGSATTINCNLNLIEDISRNGSGTLYGIQYNAPTTVTFNGDTIRNIYPLSTSSTSAFYGLYGSGAASTENLIGNQIYNLNSSSTGTQTIIGWYNNTGAGTKIVQNNSIYNLTAAGGATIYGMRLRYGTTVEVSGNNVYTLNGGLTTYAMYLYPPA